MNIMKDFPLYYYIQYRSNFLQYESSGGAFYFIAEEFLKLNGSIYGVRFKEDDKFSCEFSRATTKTDLIKLFGSKYISIDYSNFNFILENIKKDLDNDKYVLFTGKSCDINRLEKYLGDIKLYKKLYIICIFCVGFHKDKDSIRKYADCIINAFKDKLDINLKLKEVIFRPSGKIIFECPTKRTLDSPSEKANIAITMPYFKSDIIKSKVCPKHCFVKCYCDYAIGDIKLYRLDESIIPKKDLQFKKTYLKSSSFIIYNEHGLNLIKNKIPKCNFIEADIDTFRKSHLLDENYNYIG